MSAHERLIQGYFSGQEQSKLFVRRKIVFFMIIWNPCELILSVIICVIYGKRWWYSGENSCFPSSWPGFDSRPMHWYAFSNATGIQDFRNQCLCFLFGKYCAPDYILAELKYLTVVQTIENEQDSCFSEWELSRSVSVFFGSKGCALGYN